MNNWILYTSFRHLKTKRSEKGDTSTILSIIGILSGVMTMITVIGVMNGFQGSKIEKKVEIGSAHITLEPKSSSVDLNEDILESQKEIEVYYKSSDFITAASDEWSSDITGLQVKSLPENITEIDPGFNQWVEIKRGEFDLSQDNYVVVGQSFAYARHLLVGDKISLLSLKDSGGRFQPEQIDYVVSGIFRSGNREYDELMVFISNSSAEEYFIKPGEFNYRIKMADRNRYRTLINRLEGIEELSESFSVNSWRDYNTSYYNALKNEKDLMTVLIGLIFLVVGVNIYNSIRRSVYLRFEEISVLKTMGATSFNIKVIFVLESFFIGFIGATSGTLVGLWVVTNIDYIFEILEGIINTVLSLFNGDSVSLYGSQFFYLQEVPVEVFLNETIMVYLAAVFTSIIAAYIASNRISSIRPGEVIRNE